MKFHIVALLVILSSIPSSIAIIYRPVELTPDNLESNGFSLEVRPESINGVSTFTVTVTKLPLKLLLHHGAALEVRDRNRIIARCRIKPALQGDKLPLIYNFQISSDYILHSRFWLIEDIEESSNQSYWLDLTKFNTAEQGAAANP